MIALDSSAADVTDWRVSERAQPNCNRAETMQRNSQYTATMQLRHGQYLRNSANEIDPVDTACDVSVCFNSWSNGKSRLEFMAIQPRAVLRSIPVNRVCRL
jgi:hypothetical protein